MIRVAELQKMWMHKLPTILWFLSPILVTGILYDYRCAMSLLHSRINRVHYDIPTNSGALGTLYRLHCNPKLNHNFTVTRTIKPAGDGVSWICEYSRWSDHGLTFVYPLVIEGAGIYFNTFILNDICLYQSLHIHLCRYIDDYFISQVMVL